MGPSCLEGACIPEALRSTGSPCLVVMKSGSCSYGPGGLPMIGIGQLMHVYAGQLTVCLWSTQVNNYQSH